MAAKKGTIPPAAGMGRKRGVPNKITHDLRQMILGALSQAGGVDYLARQAEESPAAFLALIGKVLPYQVTGDKDNPLIIKLVEYAARMAPHSPGDGAVVAGSAPLVLDHQPED
jgi:hypothetical protein